MTLKKKKANKMNNNKILAKFLLLLALLTNCNIHLEKLYACYQYKRQSLDGQCVTAGE
jgi:hypothetical protein